MTEMKLAVPAGLSQARLKAELQILNSTDIAVSAFDPLEHLAYFEKKFPAAMELFEMVGIHPTRSEEVHDPYTGGPAKDNFTNIGEHCIAVAYCASKITAAMVEKGLIRAEDADSIVERALVHDLNKPYEIMRRDAQKAGLASDVYSVSAYEKLAPLLQNLGVSDDVAEYLAGAGRETGHNSLKDLIACGPDGMTGLVEGKIAEKIIHIADDMTFTSLPRGGQSPITAFLTPWERILASGFLERYPWLWTEGLAQNEAGEILAVKDLSSTPDGHKVIGRYAEVQVNVAWCIAREFQLYLDPASEIKPDVFLKQLVNS